MYSVIDVHVHGRDWHQSYKETLAHLLSVAARINVVHVNLMPNTSESLTTEENVTYYVCLAPKDTPVSFSVSMGITTDTELFKRNIDFAYRRPDLIKAFKLYMGESTGNLQVTDYKTQEALFKIANYVRLKIPVMTHNEDQLCLERNKHKWDRTKPWTWNDARPGESEILSVATALQLYETYPFPGGLYFCHISCPASVQMIHAFRQQHPGLKIYIATTPTYILSDTEQTKTWKNPLLAKVNPPERSPIERKGMVDCLVNSMIDGLESDHAPHTLEEKLGVKPASGRPTLPAWPRVIKWMREELGMSQERIKELTFDHPKKFFNLDDVEGKEMDDDELVRISKEAAKEYAFDPFAGILL